MLLPFFHWKPSLCVIHFACPHWPSQLPAWKEVLYNRRSSHHRTELIPKDIGELHPIPIFVLRATLGSQKPAVRRLVKLRERIILPFEPCCSAVLSLPLQPNLYCFEAAQACSLLLTYVRFEEAQELIFHSLSSICLFVR